MTKMPDPNSVGDDTLLRLGVAAALEFPDGSMGASGLRREAQHGRLKIWRIAGKDYTTKQALREMRSQCVLSNHQGSNCGAPAKAADAIWVIKDREREISTGAGAKRARQS